MTENQHHVVIIGSGFGGLAAAREATSNKDIKVTLIDKNNYHLFQPLLYQVATGSLSPADIAYPIRAVFQKHKQVTVYQDEVIDIDIAGKQVICNDMNFAFDSLIVATGVTHNYFGNDHWQQYAPGLKSIEDGIRMRAKIFAAFEEAEKTFDLEKRKALMRFVIIGSGPTGVELAGALGEIAHRTLKDDFRNMNPKEVEIILIEGFERILPPYTKSLSKKAAKTLDKLGITIFTNTKVTDIKHDHIQISSKGEDKQLYTQNIIWAAGMKATNLGAIVAKQTGAQLDRAGRVLTNRDLTVTQYKNIFIIGDLSACKDEDGNLVPGIAPAAMQQGKFVMQKIMNNEDRNKNFKYFDKGTMAIIGRNQAVAKLWKIGFSGYFAWLIWVFIHIWYLVGYDNKLLIMLQWAWSYWTDKRGSRLITFEDKE